MKTATTDQLFIPLIIMMVGSVLLLASSPVIQAQSPTFDLKIEQVTSGSKHHFFLGISDNAKQYHGMLLAASS